MKKKRKSVVTFVEDLYLLIKLEFSPMGSWILCITYVMHVT